MLPVVGEAKDRVINRVICLVVACGHVVVVICCCYACICNVSYYNLLFLYRIVAFLIILALSVLWIDRRCVHPIRPPNVSACVIKNTWPARIVYMALFTR